jgi:hypothetical protein
MVEITMPLQGPVDMWTMAGDVTNAATGGYIGNSFGYTPVDDEITTRKNKPSSSGGGNNKPTPSCKDGEVYDKTKQKCVPTSKPKTTCKAGEIYDETKQKCVEESKTEDVSNANNTPAGSDTTTSGNETTSATTTTTTSSGDSTINQDIPGIPSAEEILNDPLEQAKAACTASTTERETECSILQKRLQKYYQDQGCSVCGTNTCTSTTGATQSVCGVSAQTAPGGYYVYYPQYAQPFPQAQYGYQISYAQPSTCSSCSTGACPLTSTTTTGCSGGVCPLK